MGDKRAESKVTLVYGQMNEPPGARARVALTGECMHTLALFQDSAETYAVFAPFSPCFDPSPASSRRPDRGRVLPRH